ncbi:MAG: PilN domain-containing protein [Candidatus Omnitrophota bacterium]
MITINLLPEELRPKEKTKETPEGIGKKAVLGGIVVLISLHIFLVAFYFLQNYRLNNLNNVWPKIEVGKNKADDLKKETSFLEENVKTIENLTNKTISWSWKLYKISQVLPRGVWLRQLSLTSSSFSLQGSVVSLKQEEMSLIGKFLDNLKTDPEFSKDFKDLELGSVNRREIKGFEVSDFNISANLK